MVNYPMFQEAMRAWWLQLVQAIQDIGADPGVPNLLSEKWGYIQNLYRQRALTCAEWSTVTRIVEENEQLRFRLSNPFGSYLFEATTLTLSSIAEAFMNEAMGVFLNDGLDNIEAAFAEPYSELDAFIASDAVTYDIYVPLIGLTCDDDAIVFDDETQIRKISSEDHSWFRVGMALNTAGHSFSGEVDELPDYYRFQIHIRRSLPREVRSDTFDQQKAAAFYQDISNRIRDVLRTIAAVAFCEIIPWPAQISERGFRRFADRGTTVVQPQTTVRLIRPTAAIKNDLVPLAISLWKRLRHPDFDKYKTNRAVGLALDRLSGLGANISSSREQMLDVVIACEGFYTLEQDASDNLRFRIAINAAFFSDTKRLGISRRTIFELVYHAYKVRGRIVHGDELRASDLQYKNAPSTLPQNIEERLRHFVYYVSEITRYGMLTALLRCQAGEKIAIDWLHLIFDD